MNKHTIMIALVVAVITLALAPKLRSLPLVNKIPTV